MEKLKQLAARILPKDGFARNASVLAGGTALGQAVAMAAAPALTRLYTAEDFGHLQVYLSVLLFGAVIAAWRYEVAILLPAQDEVAANLLILSLGIVGLMSLIFAGAVWWVAGSDFLPDQVKALQPCLWLMPFSVLGIGTYQALSHWSLRLKSYSQVATTKLVQTSSQAGTQLVMGGVLNSGLFGLLLGDTLGRVSGSLNLARLAWHRSKELLQAVRVRSMWNAAVRYRSFPLLATGSVLLNTAGFALPSLILVLLYDSQVVGWFALVERVMAVPTMLVGQAISQVYMAEAAHLARTDPKALQTLFRKTLKSLLWLGAVPCVIVLIAGPMLFGFIFGDLWREAGNYARLLAVMHYVGFVAWPLIPTLNVLERQTWQLGWDIGRLILTLGSLWMGYQWGWSARETIMAYGVAMLTGYTAHLYLSHRAIQRRVHAGG